MLNFIKKIKKMAKIIYKYPLAIQEVQTIKLPANAEILTAQVQETEVGSTVSFKHKELML
jgi:hypothetical protein